MGNITYTMSRGVSSSAGGALGGNYSQVGSAEQVFDETLPASTTNQLIAASFGAPGFSSGDLLAIELLASQPATLVTNGTGAADVQTVSITGSPTGGTFVLGFRGAITAPIAYNASASTVQSALQALATIGAGNVTCTGGALPGTAVVCTFAGSLATGLQPALIAGEGGLTGGSSPAVAVAHTTPGTPQDTIPLSANIPVQWDSSSGLACPFAGAVTAFYFSCTNACRFQARILTY